MCYGCRFTTLEEFWALLLWPLKSSSAHPRWFVRDNALLSRNVAPSQMKLVSLSESASSPAYEIEAVISHWGPLNKREYLVKWKSYDASHNSWIPVNKTTRRASVNIGLEYVAQLLAHHRLHLRHARDFLFFLRLPIRYLLQQLLERV